MTVTKWVPVVCRALSMMACGGSSSGGMEKIDKMLQMEIPLRAKDRSRAVTLRAEGERRMKAGQQGDALKFLKLAKKILQRGSMRASSTRVKDRSARTSRG